MFASCLHGDLRFEKYFLDFGEYFNAELGEYFNAELTQSV
jgi:hypothetical protein